MLEHDQAVTSAPQPPPSAPATPTAPVLAAFGLVAHPFPDDPGAGPFVPTMAHEAALTALVVWGTAESAPPLAVITGPEGAGKTRVMLELRDHLATETASQVRILPDAGQRRSDAQLLREAIAAFEARPAGRTGLELQRELRARFAAVANGGSRPVLLVDGARFTGSQLEILRAVLADGPARIAVFGAPDLADRIARRPSLQALTALRHEIGPVSLEEAVTIVTTRVAAAGGAPDLVPARVRAEAVRVAAGNPGRLVRLLRETMREAAALGRNRLDTAALRLAVATLEHAPETGEEADPAAIQTRIPLPGFEELATPRRRRSRAQGGA